MMQFSPKSRVWMMGPAGRPARGARRRGLLALLGALPGLWIAVLQLLPPMGRRIKRVGARRGPIRRAGDVRDQNWRFNGVALPLLLLASPQPFPLAPRALTLALSDGFSVSLAIFQLVFSAIVSVTLWRLSAWQRRYEGLEGKLHETTTRLVDERFRAMTHEINGHVQGLLLALEEMKLRIQNGDVELRGLGERDQRIELALAAKIDLLKDYIREFAAGKKDLEKHECAFERKLGTVEQKLVDLAGTVAVISERVRE